MLKILIVDDEHIILNGCSYMIRNVLELPYPVEVLTANNVPAALEILKEHTPDLILTDIRMPVMDGFALIEHIRSEKLTSDVVILTSHADFEYAQRAIRYNVTDFILKPINESALKETIHRSYQNSECRRKETEHSVYMSLLTMLLYDVSAADLMLTEEVLLSLFPNTYFTIIVMEVQDTNIHSASLEVIFARYYAHFHLYALSARRQLIAVCNHEHFSVKPANLHDMLYQVIGERFYLGTSISTNSIHNLHALYTNACQRCFYSRTFGDDRQLAETALYSYQDCVRIFTSDQPDEMQQLLLDFTTRLKIIECPSPEFLNRVYQSFFQNIQLYLENTGIHIEWRPDPSIQFSDSISLVSFIVSEVSLIKNQIQSEYTDVNDDSLIRRLISFIASHYSEDISLEDLANAVNMHPNYVSSFFRKATGQSYLTCLHQERIAAAKRMLRETPLTIEEIAASAGYNSSTQFARIFRKYVSLSPSDYRHQ